MTLSALATVQDVVSRLGRDLTDAEQELATARLADAAVILESEIPTLNDRLTAGTVSSDAVVMVHADMVVRVLRNPDGIVQEVDGNYSRTLSSKMVTGELVILPFERRLLAGSTSTIGSFRPTLEIPNLSPSYAWRPW